MTNLTKSIFVSSFMTVAMMLAVAAVSVREAVGLDAAAGLFFANFAILGFFMTLMALRNRARTPRRLYGLTVFIVVAAGLGWFLADQHTLLVAAMAVVPVGGWILYDFWYSSLGTRSAEALGVGQSLPSFTLEECDGTQVPSEDFRGSPALLLFYRGNWCPFCMAQIREIADQYRDLADRGVQVVFVSPQPHGHTEKLAKKFDIPARFLVDVENHVARDLGLDARFGVPMGMQALGYDSETVLPTVIMTDPAGTIIYADLTDNYRVRPEPAEFLSVLDATGVVTRV